jgi:WhiB family redox-sensing transcriptional regulator
VLARCREHALAVAEPFGVWGGLSESERTFLIINQRRRPRSHYDRSAGGGCA